MTVTVNEAHPYVKQARRKPAMPPGISKIPPKTQLTVTGQHGKFLTFAELTGSYAADLFTPCNSSL